ncbi:uncharacterized protein LOC144619619 [Crassostrea virginica]
MTFEQYLAKTSMEEIQELLGNCRKFDFPVPRNAASKAYIARDSPSLSLYLQMQKFLSDELDHCCEVLLNDRKITGFLQGCHVVNTTMMASAVLVHSWKCKVPTSQMFSTLESTQNGERLFQIAIINAFVGMLCEERNAEEGTSTFSYLLPNVLATKWDLGDFNT